jgi:NADH dehydrogenase
MIPRAKATNQPHHIIVAGGGAGGLELVTKLGDTIGKRGQAKITLVERSRTHLWKPLLHSVAAGSLERSEHELNYLAQAHWHHFNYTYGEVIGLDRAAKQLHLAAMFDEEGREITPPKSLSYDTLIMAIGSVTNDFGTPGAAQYAVPLEDPEQATRFNRRLVNACLRANAQSEPLGLGQLHVAIIGAGATGTELAAELHRTVRAVLAYGLDRLDPARDVHIVLIEAAERILPALPERISIATMDLLRSIGVEVRTSARVAEVRPDGVLLSSGELIPSELVVWSAGVKAPDFLRNFDGLETNRINQLVVNPTLQVTHDPHIFAIGDCASCPQEGSAAPVPPRAQAAHQMASHMVGQINHVLAGEPLEPYRYRDFGSLVSLGKYNTIGSLMGFLVGRGMFVEGLFARLMYRSLYKMHEATLHGRSSVLWRSIVGTIAQRPAPTVKLH